MASMIDQPDEVIPSGGYESENDQDTVPQIEDPAERELARLDMRETRDLYRIQRVHLELHSGDTMVIVQFPNLGFTDCNGEKWTTKQFCMGSDKLLATGSSVFKQLLSPASQAQTLRRLRLDRHTLPCPYVLDLTPPTEGDESAAMLIQASLSPGVRSWWTSFERIAISHMLVSGHDDHCLAHNDVQRRLQKLPIDDSLGYPSGIIDLDRLEPSPARDIDDFCPIRLRANIIRLLMAIHGCEIVLNSAARVYTLACVASSLDCIDVIRDPVTVWMMADPNTQFIDINAEDALQISWMLQMADVTRAAFRIIVAERTLALLGAMDATDTTYESKKKINEQPFGRPRAPLTEDQDTCVQYAAQRFAERMQATLGKLMSDDVFDWLGIPEWRKLESIRHRIETTLNSDFSSLRDSPLPVELPPMGLLTEALSSLKRVKANLLRFMRESVEETLLLRVSSAQYESIDRARAAYIGSSKFTPAATILNNLTKVQRLMTTSFWRIFRDVLHTRGEYELMLGQDVEDMNSNVAMVFTPKSLLWGGDFELTFNPELFQHQVHGAAADLRKQWTDPDLEVDLTRTTHLVLALSDEELNFLPLWAGGLDDGTGGVYQSNVPDADLGPIGPGPSFHTGGTVATDVSSINQSTPTISAPGTVTMTAGRSLAAVRSDATDTVVGSEYQSATARTLSTSENAVMTSLDDLIAFSGGESDEDSDDDDTWEDVEESENWSVINDDSGA